MKKIVIEGIAKPETDDGGAALILSLTRDGSTDKKAIWSSISSWDEAAWDPDSITGEIHGELKSFIGKRVRITLERLDEEEAM